MTNPDARSPDEGTIERRQNDRRRLSCRSLYGALFILRRRHSRRKDDLSNKYVDLYDPWLLIAGVLIFLLSCLDAFLTLILLSHGAVEMNALMDWLIKKDIRTFATAKIVLTGLAVFVMVIHFNFNLYKILPVRYLLYTLMSLYALLIAHEISLLGELPL
jgi:ABC-type multidrug transport system fused ATPase/permease subunit